MKQGIDKNLQRREARKNLGKDAAYIGVFVALLISAQLCFAAIPGIEVVTVLFVTFSFSFGAKHGCLSAILFSLLRQFVFGFYPTVLVLYMVYYSGLTLLFGFLGKKLSLTPKSLLFLTAVACCCTACFTMFDNLLTPLWYGYSKRVLKIYFYASISVMVPHILCTAVTVGGLFLPLVKAFQIIKK